MGEEYESNVMAYLQDECERLRTERDALRADLDILRKAAEAVSNAIIHLEGVAHIPLREAKDLSRTCLDLRATLDIIGARLHDAADIREAAQSAEEFHASIPQKPALDWLDDIAAQQDTGR